MNDEEEYDVLTRLTNIEKTVDLDVLTHLNNIEKTVDTILEKMEKVETLVTKITDEVKPTIDELMGSSLFKMLGVKKGK